MLEQLIALYGRPAALRLDNGPELTAQAFTDWCRTRQIAVHDIQQGKPTQNAFIERFKRTYREEVLDAYLFESLDEVQRLTTTGSRGTTPSGPMTRWAGYRR